jgi:hypothetical protein
MNIQTPYQFSHHDSDGLAVFMDGGPEVLHPIPAPSADLIISVEIAAMNARLAQIRCPVARQLPLRIEDFDGHSVSGLVALRLRVLRRSADVSGIDARLGEIYAGMAAKVDACAAEMRSAAL